MANKPPRPIGQVLTPPGIARDGTILDRSSYIDGKWTRFQRGRPRKINGYKEIAANLDSIIRGALVFPKNGVFYMYGFAKDEVWVTLTTRTLPTGTANVANLPDLTADDLYSFQVDKMFDATGGGVSQVIVHPAQNLSDVEATMETNVYIAELGINPPSFAKVEDGNGNEILTSGGIVVIAPFLFVYGNDGRVRNSNANTPNNFITGPGKQADDQTVAATKIVKGLPIRGTGGAEGGLFWSLDSVVKATFRSGVGFTFTTVSSDNYILAPNSAIEYDGMFFWIATDRFMRYNGRVEEVPNEQNLNWFMDNVNRDQAAKIWATKVPRFGEIWWFFPFGQATECTHAIVYNVKGNFWFDVVLARSAGTPPQRVPNPLWYGNTTNVRDQYSNFAHEFGFNAIADNKEKSIEAYIETSDFGFPTGGIDSEKAVGEDYWTRVVRVEPDMLQQGQMYVLVIGEEFARGDTKTSVQYAFGPETGKIDMREQRRQIRLRFVSDEVDGYYEFGRVVVHTDKGDIRS